MEQRESDLAIVCRLAHEHLSEGAKGNDVLRCLPSDPIRDNQFCLLKHCDMYNFLCHFCLMERRLPRDFRSGVDEIVKDVYSCHVVLVLLFLCNRTLTIQLVQDIHTSIEVPPLFANSGGDTRP